MSYNDIESKIKSDPFRSDEFRLERTAADQKGPLCDTCAHRHVCRYKQEYKTINEAIRDLVIGMPREDGPETECVRLADIHWIEPIVPNCRNYQLDYGTIRGERRNKK